MCSVVGMATTTVDFMGFRSSSADAVEAAVSSIIDDWRAAMAEVDASFASDSGRAVNVLEAALVGTPSLRAGLVRDAASMIGHPDADGVFLSGLVSTMSSEACRVFARALVRCDTPAVRARLVSVAVAFAEHAPGRTAAGWAPFAAGRVDVAALRSMGLLHAVFGVSLDWDAA